MTRTRLPRWLKLAYTAFMAVLVPVYWWHYGWANFLFLCDVALFVTLAGLWRESCLLLSMAAVGIALPQLLWCLDFAAGLAGAQVTGLTAYMFDEAKPLYLRGLSLFHLWMPWLLLFALSRLGYDRRGFWAWSLVSAMVCVLSYIFVDPPGPEVADIRTSRNVNFVYGLDPAEPQSLLPPPVYLVVWICALQLLFYLPSHALLKRMFRHPA